MKAPKNANNKLPGKGTGKSKKKGSKQEVKTPEVKKVRTVPFSVGQLTVQQNTKVCNDFNQHAKGFFSVGYDLLAKTRRTNYFNVLCSHLRHEVLIGIYPDRRIDFSRLKVTQGKMLPPQNATVAVNETGLIFTWDAETKTRGVHYSDQIMLLAYFPELGRASYITAGAQRYQGTDMLNLTGIKHGFEAEIFISFIADDHRSISDSVYLGQLIW